MHGRACALSRTAEPGWQTRPLPLSSPELDFLLAAFEQPKCACAWLETRVQEKTANETPTSGPKNTPASFGSGSFHLRKCFFLIGARFSWLKSNLFQRSAFKVVNSDALKLLFYFTLIRVLFYLSEKPFGLTLTKVIKYVCVHLLDTILQHAVYVSHMYDDISTTHYLNYFFFFFLNNLLKTFCFVHKLLNVNFTIRAVTIMKFGKRLIVLIKHCDYDG